MERTSAGYPAQAVPKQVPSPSEFSYNLHEWKQETEREKTCKEIWQSKPTVITNTSIEVASGLSGSLALSILTSIQFLEVRSYEHNALQMFTYRVYKFETRC